MLSRQSLQSSVSKHNFKQHLKQFMFCNNTMTLCLIKCVLSFHEKEKTFFSLCFFVFLWAVNAKVATDGFIMRAEREIERARERERKTERKPNPSCVSSAGIKGSLHRMLQLILLMKTVWTTWKTNVDRQWFPGTPHSWCKSASR